MSVCLKVMERKQWNTCANTCHCRISLWLNLLNTPPFYPFVDDFAIKTSLRIFNCHVLLPDSKFFSFFGGSIETFRWFSHHCFFHLGRPARVPDVPNRSAPKPFRGTLIPAGGGHQAVMSCQKPQANWHRWWKSHGKAMDKVGTMI